MRTRVEADLLINFIAVRFLQAFSSSKISVFQEKKGSFKEYYFSSIHWEKERKISLSLEIHSHT